MWFLLTLKGVRDGDVGQPIETDNINACLPLSRYYTDSRWNYHQHGWNR